MVWRLKEEDVTEALRDGGFGGAVGGAWLLLEVWNHVVHAAHAQARAGAVLSSSILRWLCVHSSKRHARRF